MWSPYIICLLVGYTLADPGWKAGTRYTYEVRGRVVTGIHQASNQFSGMNTRAKLSVQPKSDDVLSLQVHGAEYAEIHANLSNGWASEIPDEEIKYQQLPIQSEPWEIKLKNGVVKEMVVDKSLPTWELNVLKSIASLLQVDTQGENLMESKTNLIPRNEDPSGVYKTMEDSIHGVYETFYDVSELPEYIMLNRPEMMPLPHLRGNGKIINVVKTRNFSNSDQHVVYSHGINGKTKWESGSNHMGNFLTRSSVSRLILTGSLQRYVIQSSVTDEKVIIAPHLHNVQKGIVASRLNLTLEGVGSAQGPTPPVSNPMRVKNLVYAYKSPSEKNESEEDSSDTSSSSSSSKSEDDNMSKGGKNALKGKISRLAVTKLSKEILEMGKYHKSSESSSSSSYSSSSSSESSESLSSSEEYYQTMSELEKSPQADLLPYHVGYKGQSIQQAQEFNSIEKAIQISREIAYEIQHPERITGESTLSKFSTLTRIMRTMSVDQYKKITEKLFVPNSAMEKSQERSEDYQAWVSFRDAVAQAGTGPALITIKEWIKSKKVAGEEAAQLLAVLPTSARYPTKDYMNAFFEMVKDSDIQKQMWLNTSAVFSFTDLVRRSMVDKRHIHNYYPVHMFGPLFGKDDSTLEEYIKYFDEKLSEAVENGDSINIQVYVQALGNIAHQRVLSSYEPYLEGQKPVSNYQRLVMIASMDKMTETNPEQIQAVLYRIYQNSGESPEVRTAAVMQLMKTYPSPQMLQRMAQQTNYDHSRQVNAAVKSAIESMANQVPNKYNSMQVENAKSAVNMLTTENYSAHNSMNFIRSFVVNGQNLAYKHHLSYIQSPDSILPKAVFYKLIRNLGGYKREWHEVQYMTSSVDQLIEQLSQQFYKPSPQTNKQSRKSDSKWSLENIYEMLNFENEGPEQLEGNLLISILGGKRFFTFDNHTVEQLPRISQQVLSALQSGKDFNYTKFYNQYSVDVAFSTAAGFPFIYSLDVPTVVRFGGQVEASLKSQGMSEKKANKVNLPGTLNVDGSYDFLYAAKRQGKMGFLTPFNSKMYLSGVEKNLQVHTPMHVAVGIDLKEKRADVVVEPHEKDRKQKVFEYSSDVYTTAQTILDMSPLKTHENTQFVQAKNPTSYMKTIGQDSHGFALNVSIEGAQSSSGMKKVYEGINNNDLTSLWLYAGMDGELSNSNITIVHDPEISWAEKARFSMQYLYKEGKQTIREEKRSHTKHMRGRGLRKEEENLAIPYSSEKKQRQEELLVNAMSGIMDAEGHMVDMSATSEGPEKKLEYDITVAYASSPASEKSRFLTYFRNSSFSAQKSKPFQAGFQLTMWNPKVPLVNFWDAMNVNSPTQANGSLVFGENMPLDSRISFKAEFRTSPERRQYLRKNPLSAFCEKQMQAGQFIQPACRNVTARANYLDSYNLNFTYKNLPSEIKNMTYMAYSVARYFGYPYHQENLTTAKEGEIQISANFSSGLRRVNVTMASPSLSSSFYRVPIHEWLRPVLVIHPQYGIIERLGQRIFKGQQSPLCVLDGGTVNTFDNSTYQVNIGNSPHVLAQSIINSEQLRKLNMIGESNDYFSILARQQSGNQLEIDIIAGDNVLEIQPAGGSSANFVFNGEKVSVSEESATKLSDEEGNNVMQVHYIPQGSYKISSKDYGFELIWSGKSVRLQVSNNLRGKVRGLCGNLDGEAYNDFMTPKGYIMNSTQSFVSSYAIISSDERAVEENRQLERGVREEVILGDLISERDIGKFKVKKDSRQKTHAKIQEDNDNEESSETYYRVKIVREPGKTCFSLKPQLSCGTYYKASKLVDKTIDFHCVQNSSASKHWEEMVKKGANPDFTQKGSNHRATLKLPQQCIQK